MHQHEQNSSRQESRTAFGCAYLAHEVEAEVVLDVPAEPLWEVADDAALVDAARGRPPLPLVLPHPLPEAPGQVLVLHPQLHAPQPRVHRLLLGRRRVQEHLPPITQPYVCRRRWIVSQDVVEDQSPCERSPLLLP